MFTQIINTDKKLNLMKKSTLLLFSLLFAGIFSFSQTTSIGIYGGINSSGINGVYDAHGYGTTQTKNIICKQFGVLFSYSLTKQISIFIDPSYIEKGFEYDQGEMHTGGPSFSGTNNIKYINVPVTLKLGLFKKQFIYIRAGGYMSFLLSAKIDDKISYPNPDIPSEATNEEINEDLNSSVFGIISGIGCDIPLFDKIHLIGDVSYQLDLSNALKDNPPAYLWNSKEEGIYVNTNNIRNRSVVFSLGIAYQIKTKN